MQELIEKLIRDRAASIGNITAAAELEEAVAAVFTRMGAELNRMAADEVERKVDHAADLARQEGYDEGFDEGRREGFDEGRLEGFEAGRQEGYSRGIAIGRRGE